MVGNGSLRIGIAVAADDTGMNRVTAVLTSCLDNNIIVEVSRSGKFLLIRIAADRAGVGRMTRLGTSCGKVYVFLIIVMSDCGNNLCILLRAK